MHIMIESGTGMLALDSDSGMIDELVIPSSTGAAT
jgi:hypothetical protein